MLFFHILNAFKGFMPLYQGVCPGNPEWEQANEAKIEYP